LGEGFLALDHALANALGRQAVHVHSGQPDVALYLVWPAGLLLDLLRQSLVFCSDFSHRLLSARVSHRLGLG
jgi:hypothetical protein